MNKSIQSTNVDFTKEVQNDQVQNPIKIIKMRNKSFHFQEQKTRNAGLLNPENSIANKTDFQ